MDIMDILGEIWLPKKWGFPENEICLPPWVSDIMNTDIPAYSDTDYSDTPFTVTLWAGPKSFINNIYG